MYPSVHCRAICNSQGMGATSMSVYRLMDKEENVVHIYNGILLSHKKEQIWVSCSKVDELTTS